MHSSRRSGGWTATRSSTTSSERKFGRVRVDLLARSWMTDVSFEEALAQFVDHLASERRASRHTVSAYRRDLEQLGQFFFEKCGELAVRRIDVFLLRGWLGTLARVVSPASVARKIAAVKALFRFLHRRALVDRDPAAGLPSPKVRKPLPTFLGVDAAGGGVESPADATPSGPPAPAPPPVFYCS